MNSRLSSIAGGLLWGTLPLAGGLFIWEHELNLSETGHELVQISLLLIVFGWAYFWYLQAEYIRLRRYAERNPGSEKVHYQLITPSTMHGESQGVYSIAFPSNRAVPEEGTVNKLSSSNFHHPFGDQHHVSNN